jgi:hypothetical protein
MSISIKSYFVPLVISILPLYGFTQNHISTPAKNTTEQGSNGYKGQTDNNPNSPDSLGMLLDEFLLEKRDTASETAVDPSAGSVEIIAEEGIILLNEQMTTTPKALRGYRIQIFFGSFEQAKKVRADHIRNNSEESCVIRQVVPSYSVRVGDFRNTQEAYLRLSQLKALFPSAIVVPDEIDLPPLPAE